MTIGSVASADPTLQPIIRAAHRLNPCLGIDVDLVAVDRATQTSTADEWNAGTLTDVVVAQDGVVSLEPGTPAAIFSQTTASSVRNPLAGSGGEPQEIAIDLFPDPNTLPSPFVLDSFDLALGRNLTNVVGGLGAINGSFVVTINAYDDDWRLVPLTDPISIPGGDVAYVGSIETIDLSSRRIVFEPGWLYARTGPGRDNSGNKRTANEDANGISRFLVPRGISIGISFVGDTPLARRSAWVGCVPHATAAQFDTTAFWRVVTNRHMGPYAPRIGGVSWNDTSGQPDDHCITGAVPGYGAKSVTNGSWGMARRVLTPTHTQAAAGSWEQPYHVLRVATYASTGSVVVKADLGATPLQETEFRADAATPKGTSVGYSLERSPDDSAWTSIGAVADGEVLTGADLARYYRLTATLTPGPGGATKYTTPYLQAWMMTARQRFSTVRYLTQIDSSTTVDPITGKSEIAELKVPMLRATPHDHRDLATTIATSFPPSRIEAQVFLTNRRTGERWFKESFRLESRNPALGVEEFTFVTGLDRLKVLIPQKTETFSHTDTATGVSNSSLDYTVTVAATSSGPFQPSPGMVGYRVFFTSGASEKKSYALTANAVTTFTFTIEDASVAPAIGDTFEIHSDAYTRAERAYAGTDFAAVYQDVMETLAAVPERYRGALPGTTGRTTSNRLLSDGRVALDVLQEVALHCGGFVTWERGRIAFKDFYGPKTACAVWDERHYVSIETPTGQERRIPSVVIPYGYDFTTQKFTNEATFDDYDALLSLGRANLSDVYKVADELAKWCNEDQAFWLGEKYLRAWSTGVRFWKVKTVLEWPWLRLGDAVSIVGRQYSDRTSAFAADGLTDQGQPIAGRTSALGVIVGANIYGDEFLVAIRGLHAIGQVIEGGTTRPDTGASGGTLATPTINSAVRDVSDPFTVDFTFTRGGGNPGTTTIKLLKAIGLIPGKYAVVATTTSTSLSVTTDDQWQKEWFAKESLADYTDSALSTGVTDDGPIEPV